MLESDEETSTSSVGPDAMESTASTSDLWNQTNFLLEDVDDLLTLRGGAHRTANDPNLEAAHQSVTCENNSNNALAKGDQAPRRINWPAGSFIDPPLGGFNKLPVRSQLRSVRGPRLRSGNTQHWVIDPDVKELMQMRQAADMVNNELQFQFRGSVSGWKLSPIRGAHKTRLLRRTLPLRPSSNLPWAEQNRANLSRSGDDYAHACPGTTSPVLQLSMHKVNLHKHFEGTQGNNLWETAAVIPNLEMHEKVLQRRNVHNFEVRRILVSEVRPYTSLQQHPRERAEVKHESSTQGLVSESRMTRIPWKA